MSHNMNQTSDQKDESQMTFEELLQKNQDAHARIEALLSESKRALDDARSLLLIAKNTPVLPHEKV